MEATEKIPVLKDFVFERTLSMDSETKVIYLVGRLAGDETEGDNVKKAIVKLEKKAFEEKWMEAFANEGQRPILSE